VFLEHRQNYDSPRVWNALRKERIFCSENRVAKLMKLNNLRAAHKRELRQTTDSNHKYPVAPNLLQRNFIINQPTRIWVTDITYIWTL
jgi:putative transposase